MFRYDEETCIFISANNLRMPSQSCFRHSDRTVFQSFHRPEAVTSYVSQKAKKTFFSVRFVFEITTYMIALTSSENPGCVRTKRATDPPLPGSLHKLETWARLELCLLRHSCLQPTQPSTTNQWKYWTRSYNQRLITKHINNKSENWNYNRYLTSRSQNYRASYAWNVQFYVPLEITMPKTLSKLMNNVCWGNKVIHK